MLRILLRLAFIVFAIAIITIAFAGNFAFFSLPLTFVILLVIGVLALIAGWMRKK
jgi:hypothetical protein